MVCITRDLQKRLGKETYKRDLKRDCVAAGRPVLWYVLQETYNRDLQKRPGKETYKRDFNRDCIAAGRPVLWYSLLNLECHSFSISNLNLVDLFWTDRGKRDLENTNVDWDLRRNDTWDATGCMYHASSKLVQQWMRRDMNEYGVATVSRID